VVPRTVIVTVGNEFRGDDGAGVMFGALVRDAVPCTVIDGGDAPENVTSLIVASRPDVVLIVDSLDFGGAPGDVMLAKCGDIAGGGVSTHGTLGLFAEYLARATCARVYVLGFQPERIGFCESISRAVAMSVMRTAETLVKTQGSTDFINTVQGTLLEGDRP
jgi:hydrogenase maturation protease